MKGFFMQGVAVLFAKCPEVSELEALLDNDYDIFHTAQESTWPMGGPGFVVDYGPEVNGKCVVHISDRQWPDDMGDPKQSPEVFGAWSMGYFGPGAFPGALGRAVLQCHAWPDAEDVVPRHRAFVRLLVTYVAGAGKDAKVAPPDYEPVAEFSWLIKLARRLLDHPDALCLFNPNGEVLMTAGHFDALAEQWSARDQPPLEAAMSVRFWNIDETWKVSDTVGLSQFDQPDHQVAYLASAHEPRDIAHFQLNIALYLLSNPGVIKSGNTADGPGGNWRVEERDKPLSNPPRTVLHWTKEGDPQPPTALAMPAGDEEEEDQAGSTSAPELPSIEEIRRRTFDWLRSPEFLRLYRKLHMPRWAMTLGALFLPWAAFKILRSSSRRGYASAQRLKQYQDLATTGEVLLAFMVIHNTSLDEDPTDYAPCLALGSFDPAMQGAAAEMANRLGALFGVAIPPPGEESLAALVTDEPYLAWRRRLLPEDKTDGNEFYLFDLLTRLNDLPPGATDGHPVVVLAARGSNGPALVVPWRVVMGKPA